MELTINKLDTHMFTDGMSNVVTNVHWTATVDDISVTGSTRLNPPKKTFQPLDELTEATVKSWVMGRLDVARVQKQITSIKEAEEKTSLLPPWSEGFAYAEPENITVKRQTYEYKEAVARLSQVVLSVGRPEVTEMLPTGEQVYNEETMEMEDVLAETVTQTLIEPLEATVEQDTYDEETGEVTGTGTVPNPLIVTDEQERAAAQAVVDATPEPIKEVTP